MGVQRVEPEVSPSLRELLEELARRRLTGSGEIVFVFRDDVLREWFVRDGPLPTGSPRRVLLPG